MKTSEGPEMYGSIEHLVRLDFTKKNTSIFSRVQYSIIITLCMSI